jgi:CarD family transcriptional regulator
VEFKVGDKVVYPNHGVGVIEEVLQTQAGGMDQSFFRLRIVANGSTVLIPITNTRQVGLRKVLTRKDVDKVFKILRNGNIAITQDWKGRFQEHSDKMRSGDIYEVAAVLKSLTLLSKSKNLSYRERKMLDKSKYLIVSEIASVSNLDEAEVEQRVDRAVAVSVKNTRDH